MFFIRKSMFLSSMLARDWSAGNSYISYISYIVCIHCSVTDKLKTILRAAAIA